MTTTAMFHRVENKKELILERVFPAPRELVFAAFTNAAHLRHWWGPRGWQITHCTVDLRPSGRWHYCMKCMDKEQGEFYGMEFWGLGIYEEIHAPDKLVYTDYFSDADGGMNPDLPSTRHVVTFEKVQGGTKVVSHAYYTSEEDLKTVLDMGAIQGDSESWDRLVEYVQAQPDLRSLTP